jgi:hypothetical protein
VGDPSQAGDVRDARDRVIYTVAGELVDLKL